MINAGIAVKYKMKTVSTWSIPAPPYSLDYFPFVEGKKK